MPEQGSSDDDGETAARAVLDLPPIGRAHVLQLLAPMYADCAAAPDLLEVRSTPRGS